MSQKRKIAYGLTAAAITVSAGLGIAGASVAAYASESGPNPVTSESIARHGADQAPGDQGPGDQGPGDRGARGGEFAASLATELGVDEADVVTALKDFRAATKPATPPAEGTEPDRAALQAALAASLADSLGLSVSDVTVALDAVQAAAQADHAAQLKTRLDAAVADGTLTQAEADAVTKAVEAGVIGGPRP